MLNSKESDEITALKLSVNVFGSFIAFAICAAVTDLVATSGKIVGCSTQ